jgi:hypothetical protein
LPEVLLGLLFELELPDDGVETGSEPGAETGAVVVTVGGGELTDADVEPNAIAARAVTV